MASRKKCCESSQKETHSYFHWDIWLLISKNHSGCIWVAKKNKKNLQFSIHKFWWCIGRAKMGNVLERKKVNFEIHQKINNFEIIRLM